MLRAKRSGGNVRRDEAAGVFIFCRLAAGNAPAAAFLFMIRGLRPPVGTVPPPRDAFAPFATVVGASVSESIASSTGLTVGMGRVRNQEFRR